MAKRGKPRREWLDKPRICDPGMCDHCTYIGDGDFLCDKGTPVPILVVESWEPTSEAGRCQRVGRRGGGRR